MYDVRTAYVLSCTVDKWFVMMQAAEKSAPEKKSKQPAAAGSADTIEQRQKDARKWINDWRAR